MAAETTPGTMMPNSMARILPKETIPTDLTFYSATSDNNVSKLTLDTLTIFVRYFQVKREGIVSDYNCDVVLKGDYLVLVDHLCD